MKTARKIGRYELQSDSFNNCQILDTATGNISARMDRFTLASLQCYTDAKIIAFADSIFDQTYYSGISKSEIEILKNQP